MITYKINAPYVVEWIDLPSWNMRRNYMRAVGTIEAHSKQHARRLVRRAIAVQYIGCWAIRLGRMQISEVAQ